MSACEAKSIDSESDTIGDDIDLDSGDGDGDSTEAGESDTSSTTISSTTNETDSTATDESDAPGDSTTESETETETESTDEDGCNSLEEIPIGGFVPRTDMQISECDPFLQNCMAGEKCVAYASDGGTWDANKCVPVLGDGTVGDPCTATGINEATDDCDADSFCWYWDENLEGECVAFCEGTPDSPICAEDYSCSITNQGSLTLCLAGCDPLQQNCAEGLGCYWVNVEFACVATSSDFATGEPCSFINDCAPGHLCTDGASLPGCNGSNCCAAYCDLDCPVCEQAGTDCTAFFEQGQAPAGFEDIGVCIG